MRILRGFKSITLLAMIFIVFYSCASAPKERTPFEQYCMSFNQNLSESKVLIEQYRSSALSLKSFEKEVGSLSDVDYDDIEKAKYNKSTLEQETALQIQSTREIGKSITPEGTYNSTKQKMKGFDPVAYAGLLVDANLNSLENNYSEIKEININDNLLRRPNKPFSSIANENITKAKSFLASAKIDLSSNDYSAAQKNIDSTNNALKNALGANPNDIQQYQISLIQKDLESVANDVKIGSAIDKVGDTLNRAGDTILRLLDRR